MPQFYTHYTAQLCGANIFAIVSPRSRQLYQALGTPTGFVVHGMSRFIV